MTRQEKIKTILDSYTKEMEGYGYFGSNPGISVDDYDDIVDEIIQTLEHHVEPI